MNMKKIISSIGMVGIGFFSGIYLYEKYNFNINQPESWKNIQIKKVEPSSLNNIPQSQTLDLSQVNSLIEKKQFDEAIKLLYDSPSDEELFFKSHYHIGICQYQRGRHQEAIQSFLEALKYNPKDTLTQACLCSCYYETKQYDSALNYTDYILKSNYQELIPEAIFIKAESLIKINKKQESKLFLEDLLAKQPNSKFLLQLKQELFQQN